MISVCMATYNGEKYIREQLSSILSQIGQDAEVIISDDGSSDETLQIVSGFQDPRIRVIQGPRQGVVKNFEHALRHARGDYVFLADQDDVWEKDKVSIILDTFRNTGAECVLHDATVVDANLTVTMPSFFRWRQVRHGVIHNLMKNSYTGCCMAITPALLGASLPFPEGIYMHDWWLGLKAEQRHSSVFVDTPLIRYRRHGENTNSLGGYPLMQKIRNRTALIKALL